MVEEELKSQSDKNPLIQESPKFFDSIISAIKIDLAGKIKNLFTKDNQSFIEDGQTNFNTAISCETTHFIKEARSSYIPINSPTTIGVENGRSVNEVLHIKIPRESGEIPPGQPKSGSLYRHDMDKKIEVLFDSLSSQQDSSNYQTTNFGRKTSIMLSPNICNKFRVDEVEEEPESLIHIDDNITANDDIRDNVNAGKDSEALNSSILTLSRGILTITTEPKFKKELMNSAEKTPSPGLEIGTFETLIVKPSNRSNITQSILRNLII